jgi:hypothetical protein
MSAVAAILSIILFLVFASSGIQKVIFNPMMSELAARLEFTKRAYQRIGALEVAGAIGLLAGLAAKSTSFWGIVNVAAAAGLTLTMVLAVVLHLRKGESFKLFAPALALGLLALLELIFRLVA